MPPKRILLGTFTLPPIKTFDYRTFVKKSLDINKIDLEKINPDFYKYKHTDLVRKKNMFEGSFKVVTVYEMLDEQIVTVQPKGVNVVKFIDIDIHIKMLLTYYKYNDIYNFNFNIPKLYYIENIDMCEYAMEHIQFPIRLPYNPKVVPHHLKFSFGQFIALFYANYGIVPHDIEFYLNEKNMQYYITDFGGYQEGNQIVSPEMYEGIKQIAEEHRLDILGNFVAREDLNFHENSPHTVMATQGGSMPDKRYKYFKKIMNINNNDPKFQLYYSKLLNYLNK